MPDYSKTIIYKICSNNPDIKEIYVGSTCNFARRKCKHKSDCNNEAGDEYSRKVYKFIRENGGWDTFDMVPIEKYPCNDKIEKEIRERYWFELLKAGLNTIYPNRTDKEYRTDTADKIKKRMKQYRIDNADKIKQYNADNADKFKQYLKQYYADNADIIKEQQKQYRANNADIIKERKKQYQIANADKIKANTSAKIICECGSSVSYRHIARHRRSTRHTNSIFN